MNKTYIAVIIVFVLGWGVDEWAADKVVSDVIGLETQVISLMEIGDFQNASDKSVKLVKILKSQNFIQDEGYLESLMIATSAHKMAGNEDRASNLLKHTAKVAQKVYPDARDKKMAMLMALHAFAIDAENEDLAASVKEKIDQYDNS